MKALLPLFSRIIGYIVIAIALFMPFVLLLMGRVNDTNLLFVKECSKLLIMAGALMILFALTKGESPETERIRSAAVRNAMFLTVFYLFGGMLYRIAIGDLMSVDTSSFVIFLIFSVICLEYGLKKSSVDKIFKR